MKSNWTLSWLQVAGVFLYAVLVASLLTLRGSWNTLGLVAGAPFLPLGYVAGSFAQSLSESPLAFVVGSGAAVAIQAWLAVVLVASWRNWRAA
jgi:hypothetical protein